MPSEERTAELSSAWQRFQDVGGEDLEPTMSLGATGLLKTLPPDSADGLLGPAAVELGSLETFTLQGKDADFRPKELLGRGGMGEVHLAVDRGLRREVALKTVANDPGTRREQALLQEALFTGFLEHPNVVPVHRLGRDESGRPVLVMKRVIGTSWSELLDDPDHPAWSTLPGDRLQANLRVLIQVCNAVQYAHSQGILHRDIKPSNVMIGAFGEVYLVDWGLALRLDQRAETSGTMVGTLAYMAPEMLDEGASGLSERTDVFLLGATLHRVLSGKPRHLGDTHYNVMLRVYRAEPYEFSDDVPYELAELCNKACARRPAQRPESALALRAGLERFLDHKGSFELTEKAAEKLTLLEAEYAGAADPREIASLLSACRFGFEQALESWPANAHAEAGLQRSLELGIEHELGLRNPGPVASLVAALPQRRPDLEERLAQLVAEVTAEATAQEKLAALQQDLSFVRHLRERARATWLTGALGGLSLLIFACLFLAGLVPFDHATTTAFVAVGGVILLANGWWKRDVLLDNQIGRRMAGVLFAGWLSLLLNQVVCWVYGLHILIVLMNAGLLMTAMAMYGAATLDRRMWLFVPLPVAGFFVRAIDPTIDPVLIFSAFVVAVFACVAWLWSRSAPS